MQSGNVPGMEVEQVKVDKTSKYSGFVGLNTELENFEHFVLTPDVLPHLVNPQSKFNAAYAYPQDVAGGFASAPIFSGDNFVDGVGFHLHAQLKTNRKPQNLKQCLACFFLPKELEAEDDISYAADEANGFGPGTVRINSLQFTNKRTGKKSWIAEKLLSVQNRPGLFLAVFNEQNMVNTDVAIFFPAQVSGATHKPVQYGEAFVFVKQGIEIDATLKQNILYTFNLLVKKSYGEDNGLYNVNTHTPLTAGPGM